MRFTDEQQEFAAAVRDFCDSHCRTHQQRDALTENGTLANSPVILEKLAGLGWLAVSLPEQYGGGGAGMVEEVIFLEETSRGLAPITAYSTGLTAAQSYLRYGTDEQKRTIVANMAAGKLEAISLSEPGAGSDLGGVRIKAQRVDDHYVINGQKTWCSAAHVAENILLLARTDASGTKHQGLTLFMVPTNVDGLEIRGIETMEARTVNDLFFTNVEVPASAVVGEPDRAWKHLMRGLSVERLIIAAMSLGAAERSLDDVIAYVKEREQFGRTISSFQAVRHRIANLATEIAASRSFVYDIASGIDAGDEANLSTESSMAKLKCTELAKATALEAMQLMGGYGYAREYGMEEQVRKALAPPIYGGTNEIQREIISKNLGL
ncbi:acyl-CoA dehydrogenase [Intrasporangium chromatireducens Q5-1]|uniref:Acyl-CoA dehydrogenase n=1 Tax=Intrasporangium chromatireducens Q5-1 TaxID=584657 RepID=W9GVC3_9MICO|nr:acyl-CoA dehydrogenase family protein [Intrasporangium chromatireducens]EWT07824.1 acyl-CoA dehydrogenase [Intrasporangium chromatireducens Q5-1]